MITPSGVRFEGGGQNWLAILPAGTYLPEPVVVEQTEQGLTAHLQAPLDKNFVFPCRREEDGSVAIALQSGSRAEVVFHPESLDYGVQLGTHREGFRADGSWLFQCASGGKIYRAEASPAGEVKGSLVQGGSVLPMQASFDGTRLQIGPDKTPLRQRVQEQGFFSGLWMAMRCATSPQLNSFLFRDSWRLFPDLERRAGVLREEMEQGALSVRQLVRPPEHFSGVKETDQSVAIGGVVLRRVVRTDPDPASTQLENYP